METRILLRASQRIRLPLPFSSVRHLSRPSSSSSSQPSNTQAHPIGDYYASILESSTPEITSKSPTTATPSSNPPVTAVADDGPSILFSSRLSSPLERRSELLKKSTLIAGVWVPPRPEEPDNCCMSGCVNCVWDRYGEEVEEWAAKRKEANQAIRTEKDLEDAKRKRKGGTSGFVLDEAQKGAVSMDDDGGGSETNWGTGLDTGFVGEGEDLFKGVPVGIREFMKSEKRLKEKHARERTSGG